MSTEPSEAAPARLPAGRTIRRALLLRCPVCGSGGIVRRWFGIAERCPACGMVLERIEGNWIGALGLNVIVTFVLLFLTLVVGFAVTYPDVPAAPMLVAAISVAVFVPLGFLPWSRTGWLAIDLLMRPLEPGESSAWVGGQEDERDRAPHDRSVAPE